MNQRQKRARDRRRAAQDLSASVVNTGGFVAAHRRDEDPEVRVPQKATGDVPTEKTQGLAKASPFFKKLEDTIKPRSKSEEKKVIAEATEEMPKQEEKTDEVSE